MLVLLDTNVLVRIAKPDDPDRSAAVEAVLRLNDDGHDTVLVPQCLYEFYVVATRPLENNGLGMEPTHTVAQIQGYLKAHRLLRDERAVFEAWNELLRQHDVRGKAAHDARLVAAIRRARNRGDLDVQHFTLRPVRMRTLDPRPEGRPFVK